MGVTDCGHYRLDLGVYALGCLTEDEAAGLRTHLRGCPPCHAELAELRAVAELLAHTAPAGTVTPAGTVPPAGASAARKRRSAGRGMRTGASRIGLSGACAARGRGRSA